MPPAYVEVGRRTAKCGRCVSDTSQKPYVLVVGVPGAKLKVLLDVIPRTLSDDDLVSTLGVAAAWSLLTS